MMVKIIALGMTPAIWKNVFHHFRTYLPEVRFSGGMFCSPEELEFLQSGRFAEESQGEMPDIIISGLPASGEMAARMSLLSQWAAYESQAPSAFALALPTLEHGLRTLVQSRMPVRLQLDRKAEFTLSDPSLILKNFPSEFPRIRVDNHIGSLQIVDTNSLLRPDQLQEGHLLGLGEIEAVHTGERAYPPATWLKNVLKSERIKMNEAIPLALIREGHGLYLFPGIPVGRVQSVSIGPMNFSHLVDLGVMTKANPQFKFLLKAIGATEKYHSQLHDTYTERLRQSEARRDLPVICKADQRLLAQSMEALLKQDGFQRVFADPGDPLADFRESALLLNLSGDPNQLAPAGNTRHLLFDLAPVLHDRLLPLDSLLDWTDLEFEPRPEKATEMTPEIFESQRERLATRSQMAASGLALARNRRMMLEQEQNVLRSASGKLTQLLDANDAVHVWSGEVPQTATQALVLSYDQEEAGAVLQALPTIPKKRWFDLSPYNEEDSLQNLSLDTLQEYRDSGMIVITATSRDRLARLQQRISQSSTDVDARVTENDEAMTFYEAESGKVRTALENLARDWVGSVTRQWLEGNSGELQSALVELRRTNERDWFHRRTVRRVYIVASNGANRHAILQACEEIYPTLGPDGAAAFPYDLESQFRLSDSDMAAVRDQVDREGLGGGDLKRMAEEALVEQNRESADQYLEVLRADLENHEADVVIVEHSLLITRRVMELLRGEGSAFEHTPAVCLLPSNWAPEDGEPMLWSRTRVIVQRRMGTLTKADCEGPMRAIYSA